MAVSALKVSDTRQRSSWAFEAGTPVDEGRHAIRLLGGGERYEAWLGWDEHLSSPVVLKLLRPDQVDSIRARAAIAREAATLGAVAHPGIVRSFGSELEGERPYLVLEFLDAPRLSTLIRRFGPLTEEQLVPLALEIGSALAYLHAEGWVHLDVKPQNLIMGAPPRLIDLSIARRQDDVGGLSGPMGTDAYMAPEQSVAGPLSGVGPWSDVWGLGATLYESAAGVRPFPRREPEGPYPQLTEAPDDLHPRTPKVLREAISACLRRDPASRPPLDELLDLFGELAPGAREVAVRRLRRRSR